MPYTGRWGDLSLFFPPSVYTADYSRLTCTASANQANCHQPYTAGGTEWHAPSYTQGWLQVFLPEPLPVTSMFFKNRSKGKCFICVCA